MATLLHVGGLAACRSVLGAARLPMPSCGAGSRRTRQATRIELDASTTGILTLHRELANTIGRLPYDMGVRSL